MATTHGTPDLLVHDDHDPDASRAKEYVIIAFILALLTAAEVSTYLLDKEIQHTWYFALGLCVLMVVKFVTVTLFFMHLKFDKRFLTVVFYSALALAIVVYLTVLTAFRFWWPSSRMVSH